MVFDVKGYNYALKGDPGPQQVPGYGQEHFGWADVEWAQSQGASNFQLWQLYDRAVRERAEQQAANWRGNQPGSSDSRFALSIGGQVENRLKALGPRTYAPDNWIYENYGGYGFGVEDINAMGATIGNLDKLKEHHRFAIANKLPIGAGVTETLSGLDADRRAEDTRKFQEKLAAEQAERDRLAREQEAQFQADLLAQQQAAAVEQQRIQQEAAHHASLVKGSSPTGVGGAASIKGSRLNITEAGGRKGTTRFTRPAQFINPLAIGQGGQAQGQSTVTL